MPSPRLALLLVAGCAAAPPAPEVLAAGGPQALAIVDATVIPMDRPGALPHQTVLVRGGRIESVGPAGSARVPGDALRIDGRGRFVLPGLADLHVHVLDDTDLELFVAEGVTAVRNASGEPFHLDWRRRLGGRAPGAADAASAAPSLFGPRLFTCGPTMTDAGEGSNLAVVRTREEAGRSVEEQARAGYDCVKVYDGLGAEAYAGAVAAARRAGLPVIGHLPRKLGLETALQARQDSIEHAEEFLYTELREGPATPERLAAIAARVKAAGVRVTPTLVTYATIAEQIGPPASLAALLARPEVRAVDPQVVRAWESANERRKRFPPSEQPAFFARLQIQARLVRALRDAGVPLLLGTDAGTKFGVPFVVPGASAHEELRRLVEAGLTPWEALRAATSEAAAAVGASFGAVAPGRDADLLVLEADPLAEVGNARRRAGVVLRGRWLPEAELAARLAARPAFFARERELLAAARKEPATLRAALRAAAPGAAPFREGELNGLGYALLGADPARAVALFELNAEAFPDSAGVWDSLGEALAAAGRREEAAGSYARSLAKNPVNPEGRAAWERLRRPAAAP